MNIQYENDDDSIQNELNISKLVNYKKWEK
jgi:hypothetical protein